MGTRERNHSLTDWDLFVLRHQKIPNVAVHLVSFLLFWLSPVLAWLISPLWLLGFFSSGLVGTFGHYLFKDGTVDAREATSSVQVVQFSSRMAYLFLTGRYEGEIRNSRSKFWQYRQGRLKSTANPKLFSKLGEPHESHP